MLKYKFGDIEVEAENLKGIWNTYIQKKQALEEEAELLQWIKEAGGKEIIQTPT